MSESRILLDAAAFMDSTHALRIDSATTDGIRKVIQRFLHACYEDLGKAPRQLQGEELHNVIAVLLPRHFGRGDELALAVPDVLAAFVAHLDDTGMLSHRYELIQAIESASPGFQAAVASGPAQALGLAANNKAKPFVHRATKTGRNDPCPCGSGKKLKKCCG
ncbi:MAG: YecA family protein [Planctomycetota bacterium]